MPPRNPIESQVAQWANRTIDLPDSALTEEPFKTLIEGKTVEGSLPVREYLSMLKAMLENLIHEYRFVTPEEAWQQSVYFSEEQIEQLDTLRKFTQQTLRILQNDPYSRERISSEYITHAKDAAQVLRDLAEVTQEYRDDRRNLLHADLEEMERETGENPYAFDLPYKDSQPNNEPLLKKDDIQNKADRVSRDDLVATASRSAARAIERLCTKLQEMQTDRSR